MALAYVLAAAFSVALLLRRRATVTPSPGQRGQAGFLRRAASLLTRFLVLPLTVAVTALLPAAIPVFQLPGVRPLRLLMGADERHDRD